MSDRLTIESLDKDWDDSNSNHPSDVGSKIIKISLNDLKHSQEFEEIKDEVIDARPEEINVSIVDAVSNILVNEENPACEAGDIRISESERFVPELDTVEVTLTPTRDGRVVTLTNESLPDFINVNLPASMPDISFAADSPKQKIPIKKRKVIKPIIKTDKVVRKKATTNTKSTRKSKKLEAENTKKSEADNTATVASVYSFSEIQRHKKRLTLKQLQDDSDSDSDSRSSKESFDPDLDVNLRIFEANEESVENVIIGEISCDVVDDKSSHEIPSEKSNKNTNIFKVSVNADFSENNPKESTDNLEAGNPQDDEKFFVDDDGDESTDYDEIAALCSVYDDDLFSDNDSDLEILTSKSIVRKRSSQSTLKKEKPVDGDKKTMFDLIYDTVQPTPKQKEQQKDIASDLKPKAQPKKRVTRNSKASTPKKKEIKEDAVNAKIIKTPDAVNSNKSNDALPVPQLKVNADGQVILDTDSLIIEQTGVAEAREAIANCEVVEESGLNYKSYSRKNNFRKQWTPHDTLKFYDVLSVVGTDFTLMATLFPGRTRNCIKRKFKKEEKTNSDLIMKALTSKQKFNIGLLEKELQLKEEKVNSLKKNAKKQKPAKKLPPPPKEKKNPPAKEKKTQRKSFFERGIACFQNS